MCRKNECKTCAHWNRTTTDSDGKEYGRCQRPGWGVSTYSASHLFFALRLERWQALQIAQGIHTESTFLCNQYEKT